ncbi:MAG: CRTAC1 family protein [Gammaproteobacteria bacterium]
MNEQPDQPQGLHEKEAIIRRAFYRSLGMLAIFAVIVATAMLWLQHEDDVPVQLNEATLTGPVVDDATDEPQPPVVGYTDITQQAGITFTHTNGAYGEKLIPEAIGSGLAFIDYDNDGDQDLLLVNSNWFPGQAQADTPTQALYRNDGRGHFTDVSQATGLAFTCYGMGVAVGDYDNDGWTDIYITALGRNHLLRNRQGSFVDVTESSNTGGTTDDWSTTTAFIDIDNDGDLDLFVGNYVVWSREIDLEIDFQLTGLGRAIGAPNHFFGTTNRLYRNDGEGTFTDISDASGIVIDPQLGTTSGKALAVAPVDYDSDGLVDLFVANDTTRNYLYHNLGNGRFEEIGVLEGIAYDRNGKSTGAMGIDAAFFRNDADLGVAIGNFANEMSSLFVTADGQAPFLDEAILEGIGPTSRLALTFGLFFFDYDLDGRLDLFQANGHLDADINIVQPSQTYAQPGQLFWNCGDDCRTRYLHVTDAGDIGKPMVGRGAAYADIDSDGDLDIAVLQSGRAAVLLRNDQQLGHHWLRVHLEGVSANRSAIGAIVELTAGGQTQRRPVMPTRSYLSQVELPVTFGLGPHTTVDALDILWPDGQRQSVPVEQVDTLLTIRQAAGSS